MTETVWKLLQVGAWLAVGIAVYFNDASTLRERMAITETRVEQEGRGYFALQSAIGERLARIERKIDCMTNERLCN